MDFDKSPILYRVEIGSSTLPALLRETVPSTSGLQALRRRETSNVWARRLDRVNVLGSEVHGHTGCVNALSWSQNGELLISSGDDQQLRVWRMDPSSDPFNEYPFACQTVIDTGHDANVFSAQMLPSSARIATVAGDRQVRVFDVGESVGRSPSGNEMRYSTRQACTHILRCHSRRTKRIITEDSPDFFLTVAEDGQVRQHDLRTPHSCTRGCPAPLVKLPHELSTIALSPLTPYQFVVGGESPYAHLFDRRHAGRYLREEWGMSPSVDDVTTCVRRFSRHARAPGERKGHEHITGARMSAWNGHELLLSFSSDSVYMYSTRDEPGTSPTDTKESSFLPPNFKSLEENTVGPMLHRRDGNSGEQTQGVLEDPQEDDGLGMDVDDFGDGGEADDDDDDMPEDGDDDDANNMPAAEAHPDAPIIYPRMRFSGHCNIETVKDVNFLGPYDEYVTSGSDDGNYFIWKKSSAELVDILEGDDSVVNVIEGHPTLPLVAVSGIDRTIKLFAPARGRTTYSRYQNATSIIKGNARALRRPRTISLRLAHLILMHQHDRAVEILRSSTEDGDNGSESRLAQCINQ